MKKPVMTPMKTQEYPMFARKIGQPEEVDLQVSGALKDSTTVPAMKHGAE